MPTKIPTGQKHGWLCSDCMSKVSIHEKHDAYFCKKCDAWVEKKCNDPTCSFCKGRPKKPSEVKP